MAGFFGFRTYDAPATNQSPFNSYSSYNTGFPWLSYSTGPSQLQQIIDYYANLLIIQYIGKPKAYTTMQTFVTPVIMDLLPQQVENGYSFPGAIGVPLDIIGKYQGVTRNGYGLQGQPISLNDTDFTKLIQLATINNQSDGTLFAIQTLLQQFFPGQIFVFDYADMRLSYVITQSSSNDLVQLFITEGLLPKPMGVQLASVIYAPTTGKLFGFRTYAAANPAASPYNTYSAYELNRPYLSYGDAI